MGDVMLGLLVVFVLVFALVAVVVLAMGAIYSAIVRNEQDYEGYDDVEEERWR